MTGTTSGGALLARCIYESGARTLFALAGATHTPLLMAFEDRGGRIVGGRHESATVGAADGYARRTGRIGFACIIAEQGLQNALAGIMTAAQSETPVVILATRFPDSWVEPAIAFAVDRHELTAPFIKFSRTVPSADRLGEYFAAACKAATEGVPGPALLVIPLDMMAETVADIGPGTHQPIALPPARASQISDAAALIGQSQRPIIVTDVGAARGGCEDALKRLAAMGIPVLGNSLGRGLVPEVAPRGYPWPYAQPAAPMADLVIVVGAKMSMWFGYGKAPRFAEDARFIHIDDNAAAIGRNRPVDLGIVAHIGDSLSQIADVLGDDGFWREPQWIEDRLADRKSRVDEFCTEADAPLHQIEIGAAVDVLLPDDRILIGDGADILNFTFGRMRVHRPRSYSDHLPMGAMGCGLPLALGMAAAEAELAAAEQRAAAPTVLVTGDGSIGFFLAELDTMRRAGLRLMVLVSNDGKWGTEYHGQEIAYGRTVNTDLGISDYAAIARAFGCEGMVADSHDSLNAAITASREAPGPVLIDVRIDPMAGQVRKRDPLVGMILFEDIAKKH